MTTRLTRPQALAVADLFAGLGWTVRVEHCGFFAALSEVEHDDRWEVHLRRNNPRAGNHHLHIVTHPVTTAREAKLIARLAAGTANDRDRAALARIAAERADEN